jgi:hypothetical protein
MTLSPSSPMNSTQRHSNFNFQYLVDQIEKYHLLRQICEIDDPSKIILTLTRGIMNLLSLAQTGRFSEVQSWLEIKSTLHNQETSVLKQMRVFEQYARQKRYSVH